MKLAILYKLKSYMQNCKIAYIVDFKDYLGGAGNHLLRHAILSKSFGIEEIVVIPQCGENKFNNDIENFCVKNKLNYCFIDYKIATDFCHLDGDKIENSMNEFIKFIEDNNIGLIHSVQLNPAVEMAARILGIPHVMSIYQIEKNCFDVGYPDMFPSFIHSDSFLYEKIWNDGLKADTICIRSYIPERFKENSNVERKYIKNKNEFSCIVSGSLCDRKSQHKIIEVAGILKKEGIKLNVKILGYLDTKSIYFNLCKSIEEKYQLKNQVIYIGFCKNVELEMKNADFLICASNDESFPQVILEAMAMRIPVISTPVAGVPELIKNNETGYLSSDFEVESIKGAVKRYVDDYIYNRQHIERVINNAYDIYEKECSKESVAQKLFGFYYSAAKNKKVYSDKQKDLKFLLRKYNDFSMDDFINYMTLSLDESSLALIKNNKFGIVYKINCIKNLYSNKIVNCYIWGASTAGKATMYTLEYKMKNFNICGFIDKFKNGEFNKIKIYKPEEIDYSTQVFIFIATGPGKKEAVEFLETKGLKVNQNYISIFV